MFRAVKLLIIGYALWLILADVAQYFGYDSVEQAFAQVLYLDNSES